MKSVIFLSSLYMLLGIIFTESPTQSAKMDTIIRDTKQKKVDNDSVSHVGMLTDEESSTAQSTNIPHGIVMKNVTFGNDSYEVHLPTVDSVGVDYSEKFVEQTVGNIDSMNDDNYGTYSIWINVNYTSSTFQLEADIRLAFLEDNADPTFIEINLLDISADEKQSKEIDLSIELQGYIKPETFPIYQIAVTVTQNADNYMWSYIQLYEGFWYIGQKKRFQTKNGHSYKCDAPDAIILVGRNTSLQGDEKAAIYIRNFYYRAFTNGTALKQVDGCQGSLIYLYILYGCAGVVCAILIFVFIVTGIIKYRQWHKERVAYEIMDRRFRP